MSKETSEKIVLGFGTILITLIVILFFYTPYAFTTFFTEEYHMYNEIKDYTKVAELEEYLDSNGIRYKKEIGDIYVYIDNPSTSGSKIQFITLGEDCQIVPTEYASKFQRIDKKENVEITEKNGKEYISFIEDGQMYVYSDGDYYISRMASISYKIGKVAVTIIALLFDILAIYIFFFYKKRTSKNSLS